MSTKRFFTILGVSIVIGLSVLAISHARTVSKPPPPAPPANGAVAMPQSSSPDNKIEVELITVSPNGFDPVEIRRPPGPFILLVENRSGIDLDSLQLIPAGEGSQHLSRLLEAKVRKEQMAWHERFNLPPGVYRLKQSEEPGWSCKITIAP